MAAGPPPIPPAEPASLFRPEALRRQQEAEDGRGLLQVGPPWTWILLLLLISGLAGALAAAVFGRVEVNGRGRGILRPAAGIRLVLAQVDGTISQVERHSGDSVGAGDPLARIEAPPVRAQLLEARRQLDSVQDHFRASAARQDQAQAEQARRLEARAGKLELQIASQRRSLLRATRDLDRNQTLEREGILSPAAADQARESLAGAERQLITAEEILEQVNQERASLAAQRADRLWQHRQTIQGAEARVEALTVLLGQTLLAAPEDGRVEAMLARPGEHVRAGQAICKLIPRQAQLQVVAFLPEKDRAFVRPGDLVHLELDQLPYAEYGTLRARVERISADLASPFEIHEALGEHAPPESATFRVELRLLDAAPAARAGVPLRSGMLLQARFTLRRQRLITLVLEPLRKWLR